MEDVAEDEPDVNGDASVLAEFLDTGEMAGSKESKFNQIIYGNGCKFEEYQHGYDVNGYAAVSRGVSKTISTQNLATLLFKAAAGQVSHILDAVPQGTMCNSIFVIDLKKLNKETDIYFDGLGTWEQNCGKNINFFRFINGEAVDARDDKLGATSFVRCTYRNLNRKTYNRVVVSSVDLGLTVIQYFFKGQEEEPFDITNFMQKGVRASTLTAEPRNRGGAKRRAPDEEDSVDGITQRERRSPGEKRRLLLNGNCGNGPVVSVVVRPPGMSSATIKVVRVGDSVPVGDLGSDAHAISSLLQYFKSYITMERQERADERQLRREEMEQRRTERLEDSERIRADLEAKRVERQEELEVRRQELSLEKSKLDFETQRWELERKEKELTLDMLRKKLLGG